MMVNRPRLVDHSRCHWESQSSLNYFLPHGHYLHEPHWFDYCPDCPRHVDLQLISLSNMKIKS